MPFNFTPNVIVKDVRRLEYAENPQNVQISVSAANHKLTREQRHNFTNGQRIGKCAHKEKACPRNKVLTQQNYGQSAKKTLTKCDNDMIYCTTKITIAR